MSFLSNRPLFKALGVSLVLHLVLLLGTVTLSPVGVDVASAPLRVVMGNGEKKGGTLPASAAAAKTTLASTRPALPLSASDSSWSLSARAQTPTSQPVSEARQAPLSEQVPGVASASTFKSAETGAAGSATTVVPQEGVTADAMRQYRMSLASAARRFKRYPLLARERGWEGTVEVALIVNSRLTMPEVVLIHSSGHDLIDEQALTMMSQAARVTPLPEGLAGRDFRVQLPVKFSLENNH